VSPRESLPAESTVSASRPVDKDLTIESVDAYYSSRKTQQAPLMLSIRCNSWICTLLYGCPLTPGQTYTLTIHAGVDAISLDYRRLVYKP